MSARVKYDGYQAAPEGMTGCHNLTVIDPGSPALGASFCIESPEAEPPNEEVILAHVARKEKQFSDAK